MRNNKVNNIFLRLQIGGSDQMGNIVSGHELISRMGFEEVFGRKRRKLITSPSFYDIIFVFSHQV